MDTPTVTFLVEEQEFTLRRELIPPSSLLGRMLTTSVPVTKDGERIKLTVPTADFQAVYDYLERGAVPSIDDLPTFDYLGLDELADYNLASVREEHMRAHMYDPEYATSSLVKEPYYQLIKLDQARWEQLVLGVAPDNCLFLPNRLHKQSWAEVQASLAQLPRCLFQKPGVFVAGGRIFSALFGTPIQDVDLFLYGYALEQAQEQLLALPPQLVGPQDTCRLMRTEHALTLKLHNSHLSRRAEPVNKAIYQIVLRLYRTPSEVIHGFDVDCCCMGYDGQDIWLTQRCLFSLLHGYNTVNFQRLSPSYEYRLAKYGSRGMPVRIADFLPSQVDKGALASFLETKLGDVTHIRARYQPITKLQGLDLLLFLHHARCRQRIRRSTVDKLAEEQSDYSAIAYSHFNKQTLQNLTSLLEYLVDSAGEYPQAAKQYLPWVAKLLADETTWRYLYIQPLFCVPRIDHISTDNLAALPHLLHIPDALYHCLAVFRPWSLPQRATFRVTNPGEQMTSTFHRTVLADKRLWYYQRFYQPPAHTTLPSVPEPLTVDVFVYKEERDRRNLPALRITTASKECTWEQIRGICTLLDEIGEQRLRVFYQGAVLTLATFPVVPPGGAYRLTLAGGQITYFSDLAFMQGFISAARWVGVNYRHCYRICETWANPQYAI